MASRGQSLTLTYTAISASTGLPATGDTANHTLYWCHDGTTATTTNTPTGVTSPSDVGESTIVLTGTECTANFGKLTGKSSTSGVVIIPISVTFEQLPTAAPAASGGLLTVGTGSGQISPSSGSVTVNGNTAQTGDVFALLNPMISNHVYTSAALANTPASSGGATAASIAAAVWAFVIETSPQVTAGGALQLIGAATSGYSAGLETGTGVFYAMGTANGGSVAPSQIRLTMSGLTNTGDRPTVTTNTTL